MEFLGVFMPADKLHCENWLMVFLIFNFHISLRAEWVTPRTAVDFYSRCLPGESIFWQRASKALEKAVPLLPNIFKEPDLETWFISIA